MIVGKVVALRWVFDHVGHLFHVQWLFGELLGNVFMLNLDSRGRALVRIWLHLEDKVSRFRESVC